MTDLQATETQPLLRRKPAQGVWHRAAVVGACAVVGCVAIAAVSAGTVTRQPLGAAAPSEKSDETVPARSVRVARADVSTRAPRARTSAMGNSEESSESSWVADAWDAIDFLHWFHHHHDGEDNDADDAPKAPKPHKAPSAPSAPLIEGHHNWFPHRWPGTHGCQPRCESKYVDKSQCDTMFYCEWDGERCWSAVGDNPCPEDEREMREMLERREIHMSRHPLLGDGDNATPSPTATPFPNASPSPSGTPVASPPYDGGNDPYYGTGTPMASGTPVASPPYDGTGTPMASGTPAASPPYDGGNDPYYGTGTPMASGTPVASPPYYGTGTPMASMTPHASPSFDWSNVPYDGGNDPYYGTATPTPMNDNEPGQYDSHEPGQYDSHEPGQYDSHSGQYDSHEPGQYDSHEPGQYDSHEPGQYDSHSGQYDSHEPGQYDSHSGQYDSHEPGQYDSQSGQYDSHEPGQYDSHEPGQYDSLSFHPHDANHPHTMFPPHDYPGTEGCEATCEGDDKTEESCTSNFFCEWDGERCWSAVGPNPCPVDEAQMHYFWENYGVEPGMFDHPHDMFPPHDYPGTEGCEATCEGDDKTEESCTSNFFCEWDGERCWSAVGPNPCPSDEKEMYDFWEEVHPHDMFPPHEYPGTDGCEATCEGDDKTEEFCTSNFYCEWDGKRCWSAVGPKPCPSDEKEMMSWFDSYHASKSAALGAARNPGRRSAARKVATR